jgi:endonuclease/exonuclease/phosphatase family metal-dependent hydrolase
VSGILRHDDATYAAGPRATGVRALLAHGALGTVLGVQALRAFVAGAVWSPGDPHTAAHDFLIPLGAHILALAGWLFARPGARRRPFRHLALALALLVIARQALVVVPAVWPYLAMAGWVGWCWWLFAYVEAIGARGLGRIAPLAVVLGFGAQAALQIALLGLDLPFRSDLGALLLTLALAAGFVWSATRVAAASPEPQPADGTLPASDAVLRSGAWGWLGFGAYFFLQVTLLGNSGRWHAAGGFVPAVGAAVLLLSYATALTALPLARSRATALPALFVAVAGAALHVHVSGIGALVLLALTQIAAAVALAAAYAARPPRALRNATMTAAGLVVFFGLLFGFYFVYELPLLWPIAAVLALGAAVAPRAGAGDDGSDAVRRALQAARPRMLPALALAALAALVLGAQPFRRSHTMHRAPAVVDVLSWNIDHGFDDSGAPSMQRIARVIEEQNPDLIALQQVSRGWTLVGGNDLMTWLRARFPDYRVIFGPTHGRVWGNAVLSRYPLSEARWVTFAHQPEAPSTGFLLVSMPVYDDALTFISLRLATRPDTAGDESRARQVHELAEHVSGRPRVAFAGAMNMEPDAGAMQVFIGETKAANAIYTATYPASDPAVQLDYVFAGNGTTPLEAEVVETRASRHRPVLARLFMFRTLF